MTSANDKTYGLIIEDLVVGHGEIAALGNDVLVHYVGRLENGGYTRPSTVRRLAEALSVTPGELMRAAPSP